MQINKKITVLIILFLAVIFLLPEALLAQTDVYGTGDLGDAGINLGTRPLRDIIGGIVNIVLGFLGVLATLIVLYGGFMWMTSRGNAEKVDQAKRVLINGVIGLVIVLSSYAIASFILRQGYNAIFNPGGTSTGPPGYVSGVGLGGGVINSHYPTRNAVGIPRNTNIVVIFNEPIDLATIIGPNCVAVGIMQECDGHANTFLFEYGDISTALTGADLRVSYDPAEVDGP
ncbi:TrbC/VirB2 family protein, partial [bacterium]|nr:TrbC/VirB2 family protein [bacterium]